MSEEHFDDKIRQKLNQIQPPYTPQAWDRFKALMPVPWYVLLWQSLRLSHGALLLGLGSMVYTYFQTQTLSKENEWLRQQMTQTRVDTVYQVRYDTLVIEKRTIVYQKWVAPSEKQIDSSPERMALTLPVTPAVPVVDSPITPTTPSETSVVEEDASVAEEEPLAKEPASSPAPLTPETGAYRIKRWKVPHTRIGLAVDYAGLKVATIGPQFEVFLARNLSIQTGILVSGQQSTVHARPMDFNLSNGISFEDKYKNQINNIRPVRIQNIEIKSSFLQVPIQLKYLVPTPSAFSFQFMAGTKLDYRVLQEITFLDGLMGDVRRRQFDAKQTPRTFHSLTYGMGLQYQRGRLVGQFMPYFDFPFRSSTLGNTVPRRLGIHAGLSWDLYPEKRKRLEAWN